MKGELNGTHGPFTMVPQARQFCELFEREPTPDLEEFVDALLDLYTVSRKLPIIEEDCAPCEEQIGLDSLRRASRIIWDWAKRRSVGEILKEQIAHGNLEADLSEVYDVMSYGLSLARDHVSCAPEVFWMQRVEYMHWGMHTLSGLLQLHSILYPLGAYPPSSLSKSTQETGG